MAETVINKGEIECRGMWVGSGCRRNVDVSRVEGWFGGLIWGNWVRWGGKSVGNIRGLRVTLRVNLGWFWVELEF